MLRSGGAASLGQASLRYVLATSARTTSNLARASTLRQRAPHTIGAPNRAPIALVSYKPFSSTSLQRYAAHPGGPFDQIDKKHEEAVENEKIEAHPEEVSSSSTVHQVFSEKGVEEEEEDTDMLAGVKSDLVSLSCSVGLGNALIIGAAENCKGDFRSR